MGLGIILYVHGARDARWSEPFERLRDKLAARMEGAPVRLAFLEYREPDLTYAALELANGGATRIRVVPMFFGRGGHLREDFPRQLAAARARLPEIAFEITAAAGEDDTVLEALASFAANAPATRAHDVLK
jgi:sirohydrochlorin cobaltochelatase